MNFKSAFRFTINDSIKSLIIFYSIILALNTLIIILNRLYPDANGQFNGFSVASIIFIFVVGINMFKESFLFLIQHGRSRLTLVKASLCSISLISLVMVCFDLLVIKNLNPSNAPVMVDSQSLSGFYAPSSFAMEFIGLLLSYVLVGFLGLFLGALYYRMDLAQKIIVSVGVPMLIIIVLPIIDFRWTDGVIMQALLKLFLLAIIGATDIQALSSPIPLVLTRLGIVAFGAVIYYISTIRVRVKA